MSLSTTELRALEQELTRLEGLQDSLLDGTENGLDRLYRRRVAQVVAQARDLLRDIPNGSATELAQARVLILDGPEGPLRAVWTAWQQDLDEILSVYARYHDLVGATQDLDPGVVQALRGFWPVAGQPQGGIAGQMYQMDRATRERVADVMTQSVLGNLPQNVTNRALADASGRSSRAAKRLFHDETMKFSRAVNAAKTANYRWFQYTGPKDAVTRDFCSARVNKIFSRGEINAMDNGQTPGVFTTGGGYRCRHTWRPVRRAWYSDEAWEERRP